MSDQDVHDAAMLVELLRAHTPAMGPDGGLRGDDDDDEEEEEEGLLDNGEEGGRVAKRELQVARGEGGGQAHGHHYGV